MEIRERYKNTDIGEIPVEWNTKRIHEVAQIISGGTPSKAQDKYWKNGNIAWVTPTDITSNNDKYIYKTTSYITEEGLKESSANLLPPGSILMTSRATIGACSINKVPMATNQGFKSLICGEKLLNEYLYYLIDTLIPKLVNLSEGSTFVEISKKDISNLEIPLPSLSEQKKIASALADIDELIRFLNKLIKKKKNIKQGMLQELLRPRSGWIEKVLGETAILKARIGWQGLTTAEYRETGDFILITGTDFKDGFIDWSNCCYVDKSRYDQDRNIQIKVEDVLVTKDGTIGKVAFIHTLPKPATLNSGVFVIRPIQKLFYPHFFYYILLSKTFDEFLTKLSAGSTITHLYQKDFVNFKFLTPPTIEEQIYISNVLSSMDNEIQVLEEKLCKYKNIKQGMMQELLNGRIRLVEEV